MMNNSITFAVDIETSSTAASAINAAVVTRALELKSKLRNTYLPLFYKSSKTENI